jgi:hypothetical protein
MAVGKEWAKCILRIWPFFEIRDLDEIGKRACCSSGSPTNYPF